MEPRERVAGRRVARVGDLKGRAGGRADAALRVAEVVLHALDVGVPGDPGAVQLVGDRQRLDRIHAAVAGNAALAVELRRAGRELVVARAVLLGELVGRLPADRGDVVGKAVR